MVLSFPLFLFLSSPFPFLFLVCSKRELSCTRLWHYMLFNSMLDILLYIYIVHCTLYVPGFYKAPHTRGNVVAILLRATTAGNFVASSML